MYFNELIIILALLLKYLKGGLVNLKREVKQIEANNLAHPEVNKVVLRSFLECVNLCGQTDTCLSVFYKDRQCWLVTGAVLYSSDSCFQLKSEFTTAFVGLDNVSLF